MSPDPRASEAQGSNPASAGGAAPAPGGPPAVGFDGVQQPALGPYPPVTDAKPQGGYPTVAPVTQPLPTGYPGAPAPAPPAGPYGGPPRPPHAVVGMPVGAGPVDMANDKIGPLGITAWALFAIGIFFPFTWFVCVFLLICAQRAAKGPKDLLAVRRAAVASAIAMLFYVVLLIIFVPMSQTYWRNQRACVDSRGYRIPC